MKIFEIVGNVTEPSSTGENKGFEYVGHKYLVVDGATFEVQSGLIELDATDPEVQREVLQEIDRQWRDLLPEQLAIRRELSKVNIQEDVKNEYLRRLTQAVPIPVQLHMIATLAADLMSDDDKAAFIEGLTWEGSLRATALALVTAKDVDYAEDGKWPAPPAAIIELAQKY